MQLNPKTMTIVNDSKQMVELQRRWEFRLMTNKYVPVREDTTNYLTDGYHTVFVSFSPGRVVRVFTGDGKGMSRHNIERTLPLLHEAKITSQRDIDKAYKFLNKLVNNVEFLVEREDLGKWISWRINKQVHLLSAKGKPIEKAYFRRFGTTARKNVNFLRDTQTGTWYRLLNGYSFFDNLKLHLLTRLRGKYLIKMEYFKDDTSKKDYGDWQSTNKQSLL